MAKTVAEWIDALGRRVNADGRVLCEQTRKDGTLCCNRGIVRDARSMWVCRVHEVKVAKSLAYCLKCMAKHPQSEFEPGAAHCRRYKECSGYEDAAD